jgi:hypothetical protein
MRADWTTTGEQKEATEDLHHHHKTQVKRGDHTFSSKNCMETKVHSAKTKLWASFFFLEDYNIQRRMNKQSGFNAEQIEKDNYPESKTVWRSNLKWQVNTAKQKPTD